MRGPLVVKRAFSEPLLLLAAFGSILLATTTLVALTMYAASIADIGVRRTMETASLGQKATVVSAPVSAETFAKLDGVVRDEVGKAYGGSVAQLTRSFRSDSYVLPGQEGRKTPELLRFGSYDGLEQQAKLVDGAWPAPGGQEVQAAISLPASQATGFKAGQDITTVSRLDGSRVRVRITGIFQLDDPAGDRWTREPLLGRGVETGDFTTYGPLMVPQQTFLSRFAKNVNVTWTAVPDLRSITPEQLRPLAARGAVLQQQLAGAGCSSCTATSRLPEVLTQLGTASLVARSTMLIPVLQLLLLAAYALMLTARLLADHRRMEVALLRSRGAGTLRLASLAGGEALLVAIPCAVIAPFLGPPLLSLVNALPWIEASGVRLDLSADLGTFLVSIGVAAASAVLLMLPALAGARRTYVEEQAARGRGGGRGLIERAGADLALLVVAGLAIWQLQHYGAPVTATSAGELGIDPLIISGPALALLTGGMLGLRLVPRISRVAERITAKRPTLAPALGAWQVSRRPLKYAGPALLLTMAVAIGIVSLSTASTWRGSQADQARHQAGADLRLAVPPDGPELGAFGAGTAFAALPGVTGLSPSFRGQVDLGSGPATLITLDGAKLADVMRLRPDLTTRPLSELGTALAAARPQAQAIELPGKPATLSLTARTTLPLPLRLTISDGLGVWHDLPAGMLRQGDNRLRVDLSRLAGRSGEVTYPLYLRGVVANPPSSAMAQVAVTEVSVDGRNVLRQPYTMEVPESHAVSSERPDARPLPIVVTADLAASLKLAEGKAGRINLDGRVLDVTVAGVVDSMPTAGGQPALLIDWATLQGRDLTAGLIPRPATEWWVSTPDGRAAAAVRAHPEWDVTAVDQRQLATKLRDDPLASGLQGALILGFAAALIFAALGFLVNATVAARERMSEFTILRALGVSFRQVFGLLAIEQTFVIGLSLLAGTLLAVAVGVLVVPHIVLTGQASAVTPGVLLSIPWGQTAAMLVAVAALLFAIVAGLARNLRRQGLGRVLRIGEDQ